MKKILAGMLTAAVITASACSQGIVQSTPDMDRAFSAEASISAAGETISGQLCRNSENDWTLTVNEPFALSGLTVSFCDGKTTVSMLGFECETDFSDSAVSVLKLIAEAYETAASDKSSFENGVHEAVNENGAFTVTLDQNGMPAVISAGGITVQLSQWAENTTESISDEVILLE